MNLRVNQLMLNTDMLGLPSTHLSLLAAKGSNIFSIGILPVDYRYERPKHIALYLQCD